MQLFSITYDLGHEELIIQTNELGCTITVCLGSNAKGSQVLFNERPVLKVDERYTFFDNDEVPFRTNNLLADKIGKMVL